jgi:hypothetical protein
MEQKINAIVYYIYKKKGVVLSNVIPPRNEREMMLLSQMYNFSLQNP